MKFAIVPACGQSTRMGQPKAMLSFGKWVVLEQVIATLKDGGAETVLVVTGPHVTEVSRCAGQMGVLVHELPLMTPDMRSTVEAGFRYLEERFHPASDDPWLLSPVDHPCFKSSTVRSLFQMAGQDSSVSIVVPTCQTQHGHPVLFRWKHRSGIMDLPVGDGINKYVSAYRQDVYEMDVDDPGVLLNVNTPEGYAKALGQCTIIDW